MLQVFTEDWLKVQAHSAPKSITSALLGALAPDRAANEEWIKSTQKKVTGKSSRLLMTPSITKTLEPSQAKPSQADSGQLVPSLKRWLKVQSVYELRLSLGGP